MLPGAVLIFAGAVLGAWIDDWSRVSGWTLGVIGVLALREHRVRLRCR